MYVCNYTLINLLYSVYNSAIILARSPVHVLVHVNTYTKIILRIGVAYNF